MRHIVKRAGLLLSRIRILSGKSGQLEYIKELEDLLKNELDKENNHGKKKK